MKMVEIEALMTFKYSPNGSHLRTVQKGLEFEVTEKLAKKLTAGDPPRAKYLGDEAKKEEIVEEESILVEEIEEVVEEVEEEVVSEDEIDLSLVDPISCRRR
jgi:hypothetical protein